MRRVKVIEHENKEAFEREIETFIGDSNVDVVEMQYSCSNNSYSALFIYRLPSSEG